MAEKRICPKCGAELPGELLEGQCPRCMGRLIFGGVPDAGRQAAADNLGAVGDSAPAGGASTQATSDADQPAELTGQRIGHYKLLEKIGEGGFGVVYMAEQVEPVQRRVAFKIIKAGMDSRQIIARFEAERQALALMDHPNIAKVLDAGATETGRPYFVMELVRGIKITNYCDLNNLPTADRLELFAKVCNAVQHAHQKGIIHRDIKPSNILVTLHEGVPVPKVIDFGIAKATERRLTEKTLFTALEQFIGTPAYMSPEQAEMSGLDIDTRSDIYSLGVLLYELLTGKTPFDAKEMAAAGLEGIRRMIRERDPVRPSTRLSTLDAAEQTAVARRRQVEPPKLVHLVRGDLDWIVMKCLEKDRTRRYETANDLAMDIRRHSHDEAVMARPPSKLYRLQKTVRRNKIVFAAGGAVLSALVLGLAFSLWQFAEKTKAYQREKTQAEWSRQVTRFLEEMLRGVGPSKARGRDTLMLREILDQTADRAGKELKGQPAVECELRRVVARTYQDLGEFTKALAMGQEALRLSRALFGEHSLAVADALTEVGAYQVNLTDWAGAEQNHRRALSIRRKLLGEENAEVASSMMNVGVALSYQGKYPEAERMILRALETWKKLSLPEDSRVALGLKALAATLHRQGKLPEAEANASRALALDRRLHRELHPDVVVSLNTLGVIQQAREKFKEAQGTFQEALTLAKQLGWKEHPYVASLLANLGVVLESQGQLTNAISVEREALVIHRKLFGNDGPKVASVLANLGGLLEFAGRWKEAETNLQEALVIYRKLPDNDPDQLAITLDSLGNVLRDLRRLSEAQTMHEEELQIERSQSPPNAANLADALASLSLTLLAAEKPAAAEPLARECLTLREKSLPEDWQLFCARSVWGETMAAQSRYRDAEKPILEGYRGLKACEGKLPLAGKACLEQASQRIIRLYQSWGKQDEVAKWRAVLGSGGSGPGAGVSGAPTTTTTNR